MKRLGPGGEARIPLARGAREILAYHDADPLRQVVDTSLDATMDRLVDLARRLE